MIFQHTWEKVLTGEKSQTRRLVKPGEYLDSLYYDGRHDIVRAANNRIVHATSISFEPEKTYAVQPGRGKAAVARIRILSIRREDVREISDADVEAEGFQTASDFFIAWVKMHDKSVITPIIPDYDTGAIIWQGVRPTLATRPAERYQAWVLEFELVKGEQLCFTRLTINSNRLPARIVMS